MISAEGAGVEPARAFARWFSKPLPYRPVHPPPASLAGIEPTLRDPQSRGLSVSLQGQHEYFSMIGLPRLILYPPRRNQSLPSRCLL